MIDGDALTVIDVDAEHALTTEVRHGLRALLGAPRTPEASTPTATAALLLDWIESRGAIARLCGVESFLHIDLNPIADMTQERADLLSRGLLGFRDELRQMLLARRVTH